jgi:hypothetical protein
MHERVANDLALLLGIGRFLQRGCHAARIPFP